MMWWWNGDWNWAAWLTMTVSMLVFWGLVIWGVVVFVRGGRADSGPVADPERILAERFARGEIDAEEYHQRVETLHLVGSRANTQSGGRS